MAQIRNGGGTDYHLPPTHSIPARFLMFNLKSSLFHANDWNINWITGCWLLDSDFVDELIKSRDQKLKNSINL